MSSDGGNGLGRVFSYLASQQDRYIQTKSIQGNSGGIKDDDIHKTSQLEESLTFGLGSPSEVCGLGWMKVTTATAESSSIDTVYIALERTKVPSLPHCLSGVPTVTTSNGDSQVMASYSQGQSTPLSAHSRESGGEDDGIEDRAGPPPSKESQYAQQEPHNGPDTQELEGMRGEVHPYNAIHRHSSQREGERKEELKAVNGGSMTKRVQMSGTEVTVYLLLQDKKDSRRREHRLLTYIQGYMQLLSLPHFPFVIKLTTDLHSDIHTNRATMPLLALPSGMPPSLYPYSRSQSQSTPIPSPSPYPSPSPASSQPSLSSDIIPMPHSLSTLPQTKSIMKPKKITIAPPKQPLQCHWIPITALSSSSSPSLTSPSLPSSVDCLVYSLIGITTTPPAESKQPSCVSADKAISYNQHSTMLQPSATVSSSHTSQDPSKAIMNLSSSSSSSSSLQPSPSLPPPLSSSVPNDISVREGLTRMTIGLMNALGLTRLIQRQKKEPQMPSSNMSGGDRNMEMIASTSNDWIKKEVQEEPCQVVSHPSDQSVYRAGIGQNTTSSTFPSAFTSAYSPSLGPHTPSPLPSTTLSPGFLGGSLYVGASSMYLPQNERLLGGTRGNGNPNTSSHPSVGRVDVVVVMACHTPISNEEEAPVSSNSTPFSSNSPSASSSSSSSSEYPSSSSARQPTTVEPPPPSTVPITIIRSIDGKSILFPHDSNCAIINALCNPLAPSSYQEQIEVEPPTSSSAPSSSSSSSSSLASSSSCPKEEDKHIKPESEVDGGGIQGNALPPLLPSHLQQLQQAQQLQEGKPQKPKKQNQLKKVKKTRPIQVKYKTVTRTGPPLGEVWGCIGLTPCHNRDHLGEVTRRSMMTDLASVEDIIVKHHQRDLGDGLQPTGSSSSNPPSRSSLHVIPLYDTIDNLSTHLCSRYSASSECDRGLPQSKDVSSVIVYINITTASTEQKNCQHAIETYPPSYNHSLNSILPYQRILSGEDSIVNPSQSVLPTPSSSHANLFTTPTKTGISLSARYMVAIRQTLYKALLVTKQSSGIYSIGERRMMVAQSKDLAIIKESIMKIVTTSRNPLFVNAVLTKLGATTIEGAQVRLQRQLERVWAGATQGLGDVSHLYTQCHDTLPPYQGDGTMGTRQRCIGEAREDMGGRDQGEQREGPSDEERRVGDEALGCYDTEEKALPEEEGEVLDAKEGGEDIGTESGRDYSSGDYKDMNRDGKGEKVKDERRTIDYTMDNGEDNQDGTMSDDLLMPALESQGQ